MQSLFTMALGPRTKGTLVLALPPSHDHPQHSGDGHQPVTTAWRPAGDRQRHALLLTLLFVAVTGGER